MERGLPTEEVIPESQLRAKIQIKANVLKGESANLSVDCTYPKVVMVTKAHHIPSTGPRIGEAGNSFELKKKPG